MIKTQRGWTIWSLLFVIVVILIVVLLFMKLMPVYLDNYKLKEAMQSVAEDPRAADWDKRKIIREMNNILYIDYGADIVDLNTALTIEKTDTHSYIKVKYEVVVPMVHNLSALVNFDDQTEIVR